MDVVQCVLAALEVRTYRTEAVGERVAGHALAMQGCCTHAQLQVRGACSRFQRVYQWPTLKENVAHYTLNAIQMVAMPLQVNIPNLADAMRSADNSICAVVLCVAEVAFSNVQQHNTHTIVCKSA
jgi:hypothetical protein